MQSEVTHMDHLVLFCLRYTWNKLCSGSLFFFILMFALANLFFVGRLFAYNSPNNSTASTPR